MEIFWVVTQDIVHELANAAMLLGLVLYKSYRIFQNKEQSRAILTRIKNNENQI